MGFFKKWDGKESAGTVWAERIASLILIRQRKLADYLNLRARRVSVKSWWIALTLFCLVSGIYLIYLLMSSVF